MGQALQRWAAWLMVLLGTVCAWPAPAEDLSVPMVWRDPHVAPLARADDLLSRLSTQEKVAQLMNHTPAIPRLGVPAFDYWSEGLHGLARNGDATVFPQAIGLAATWDTQLLQAAGAVVASEARARFFALPPEEQGARYAGLTLWSPNINIFRDPRWGRGQETYGEDPFLAGRLAMAFVRGLQGNDPVHPRVIATPKHFAVHSGPEPLRHGFNARPSAHDLEDTYLPAFRAAVVEGGARSVMCAYNAIDGTPACANETLLRGRLREDWAFNGFVVADCDAIDDMTAFHHYRPDSAESAALALKAGTDLDCGPTYGSLNRALERGLASERDIDGALRRLLTARFAVGAFDPPDERDTALDGAEHMELALRAARESIVLLKNTGGTLPLVRSVRRIAVIGPGANLLETLEGNYHGTALEPVTPLAGIQREFAATATVDYAQGSVLADQVSVPVPITALRGRLPRTGGLEAEFFTSLDFSGTPAHVRSDPAIDFDWDRVAPAPGVPAHRYAVRWSGEFVPPAPGPYQLDLAIDRCFDCNGHDSYRLYLDGHLIADGSGPATPLIFENTLPHTLKIELLHDSADGGVHLEWRPPQEALLGEALSVARRADVIVAVVGLSPRLEGEALRIEVPGFAGGDRISLDLPAVQRHLLAALARTGRPLIIVLQTGSAVALDPELRARAKAILVAWYPGGQGGRAIAQTLAGINNPSGRLPVTFYRSVADLPAFDDYTMAGRTYRYFTRRPDFPFGYGLSYTSMRYADLELSAHEIGAGENVAGRVRVTNTGARPGEEIVQLYMTHPDTKSAPLHALAGFQRVHLLAGESKVVSFVITPRQMSLVDEEGRRAVIPGRVVLDAGGGQPGYAATLRDSITIRTEQRLPR
ncbi:MAG: glycoside hydrolase family 3 C-terminal domain-containing protein [Steroidobacteraceae bacterium]